MVLRQGTLGHGGWRLAGTPNADGVVVAAHGPLAGSVFGVRRPIPPAAPVSPATEDAQSASKRPNIVFIMSDDHASHAIGCYGSKINTTPPISHGRISLLDRVFMVVSDKSTTGHSPVLDEAVHSCFSATIRLVSLQEHQHCISRAGF